jgi:TATA-box binding protein (TBP) (component of TFIID and TFIIIB)
MAANAEKVKMKIDNAIKNSDQVKEGNYISVKVLKTGFLFFGSKKIQLTGRATSEKMKEVIEGIAKEHVGDLEMVSEIRVSSTS